MNSKLKLKKPSRLEWIILLATGGIVMALASWWAVSSFIDSQKTYPLGDKLEYIGKVETKCPTGFTPEGFKLGFCKKTAQYYYATDMNIDETRHYFKNTTIQSLSSNEPKVITNTDNVFNGLTTYYTSYLINNSMEFSVNYYAGDNLDTVVHKLSLKQTQKKHLMILFSGDYKEIAQYAL